MIKNEYRNVVEIAKNIVIFSAAIWGIIATIDRLYWINSGNGLTGAMGKAFYKDTVACNESMIEVKEDRDGILVYRCGNLWPFYSSGKSEALTALWGKLTGAVPPRPSERSKAE